jgi:tetratricopeptide (TPR) repeat protein
MTTDTIAGASQQASDDPEALRAMAGVAAQAGRDAEAEQLLQRAVALAPGSVEARFDLAWTLHRLDRPNEVVEQLRPLIEFDPDNQNLMKLMATMLERSGQYDEAVRVFEQIVALDPEQSSSWSSLGHVLRTVGRTAESVEAYRQAVRLKPRSGEGWWGLANLKTAELTGDDITAIRAALANEYVTHEDMVKLRFALGKALEDAGDFEESFREYSKGNALRREDIGYRPEEIEQYVDRAAKLFTPAFFAERKGHGASAPDPIFIIGLPRSGSTLVDQILSSHPLVEGTAELPDLLGIARQLRLKGERDGIAYPEGLAKLSASECAAIGEQYLERTRRRRSTDKPFFIDKTPNNWAHVGLIQLILPNAKIVDVRRHPLGCCVSNFRQYFAIGQEFTYSLSDLGHYYRDYVRLMRHFDEALPGRVQRLIYEQLVEDLEGEARRLLGALGLEFDPAVLKFHENERAVATPSAEQVRRPINREGMDNWQPFEPWLAPLKKALGPVLTLYPEAP